MGQPKSGSSTVAPSPSGVAALNQVLPQVQQYLSPTTNPYVPVTQQIAQQNPEQLAAAGQYSAAFGAANTGLGTYGQASDLIQGAAQPLTQAEINQYFNPYVNQVVGATEQQFNLQNAQQQNQVVGNEATQGALGGNRTAVAGALTAAQQAAQEDPIIAGMLQAGYTQQEAMAAQQYQQTPLAAASALQQVGAGQEAAAGNLGNLALGQYGLGSLQQNYYTPGAPTTATLNALYAEQLAKYGYPIQLTNMAAGDVSGISGAYGSTTTTTPPPPSLVSGLTGLGLLGVAGVGGYNAYQASDRRLKEDIKVIGKTKDGQTIYRFRFKGHPQWHIGLMAQDVEKKHPEAVKRIGGYKAIDVKKATDAAARFAGGRVQGLQTGGIPAMPYGASPMSGLGPMPYAGGGSYLPQVGATNFARLPSAPPMAQPQDDSSKMFMDALKLSKLGSGSQSDSLANYSPAEVDYAAALPGSTGGRVPRAYGGLALPSSNRINVPTRGGLGMPSSMVMRRDAGGSADMSDTGTSTTPDIPAFNPLMATIAYGQYGNADPYGLSTQGMAEGGTPKDDIAPDDTVLVPDDAPPPEAPVQVAQGPAPAGVASDAPEIISTGVSRRAPEDPRGMVPYIRETAKKYGIDPNVAVNVARSEGLGTFTSGIPGEKSFGAFQLNTQGGMGNEFYRDTGLDPSDPRNEKATIDYALSKASTGGWGPFHGAKNRYGYDNFAGINGNDGTQALALSEDTSGRGLGTASTVGGIPGVTPIKAPDLSGKTKPNKDDIWMSLLAAGLGMMGSRSPYAGVGIGQGGLQGVQTYEALHKQRVGEAEHQAQLQMSADTHNQAMQVHLAQQAIENRRAAEVERHNRVVESEKLPIAGYGQSQTGERVPGAYAFNPDTKKWEFSPGMELGKMPTNAKSAADMQFIEEYRAAHGGQYPTSAALMDHQNQVSNLKDLDSAIVNQTEHYPDLKDHPGALHIAKGKDQDRVRSAFESGQNIEDIASYTRAHPGAIGLLAKASNNLNLDAYRGLFDEAGASKGAADMDKAIDNVASGNVNDTVAAKRLNKMLIAQAFKDASAAGQRGGVYLDKVFRDLYQQASSPEAFYSIIGERYNDANKVLDEYKMGYNRRDDKESRPFWERLQGHGTETSATAIDPRAVQKLKDNPSLRDAFDQKYGKGEAAKVLGQ